MESTPEVKCPKCGSTQITANKKGFSAGKAIGGAILTGGIGLLAGAHGSGKIIITCLACGNKFKPGDKPKEKVEAQPLTAEQENFGAGCAFVFVIIVLIFCLVKC